MSDKRAEAAPKKGRKMVMMAAVAAVVLAGGGGAFWWHSRSVSAEADGESGDAKHGARHAGKGKARHEDAGGIVPLEPFIVNLSGSHYLRTTLKLVVPDEKLAEKLAKNEVAVTRVRSTILELLSQQTAQDLVTAEGKTELKKEITERIAPLTGDIEVTDVLFSDFVVQF
jgi:flagellar FliL protein